MELQVAVSKRLGAFSLSAEFTGTGSSLGVFGASGSGKSTLVGLIAGLQEPDGGMIALDGEVLFDSRRHVDLSPEKRNIGIVFQHPHLFPHLNVRRNLLYGFNRRTAQERQIDLASVAGILQLEHLLDRGIQHLSGGEQQRVAIGRAILSNPRLLLMDEPLSALDDTLKYQIIAYLRSACTTFHIPYLFISHSLVEMRLMTDQVIAMDQGAVAAELPTEQLARQMMGASTIGYINLLKVRKTGRESMIGYSWGRNRLLVSVDSPHDEAILELSSRDIILCKNHPTAISARNLLVGRVVDLFAANGKSGIEIDCNGERLIAEVVDEAARELSLEVGGEIFAVIKASAFRLLQ